MAAAVDGAEAVVNMVGHYVERGKATFEAIARPWRNACRAGIGDGGSATACSHIGPRHRSDIRLPYARARGIGEQLVTEAFPAATILRPASSSGPRAASSIAWRPWRA